MNKTKTIIMLGLAVSLVAGCVTVGSSGRAKKGKDVRENRLGYVLPKYNFSIDANYDPRAASLIQGYTGITVAVTNKGLRGLLMRPDKDHWKVKDREGKWHRAILDIQYEAPEAWERLPIKARGLVLYPDGVPAGHTQTFQIFIPGTINLAGFDRIKYYSADMKKAFTFTRY